MRDCSDAVLLSHAENATGGAQPRRSAYGCAIAQLPALAQGEKLGDVVSHRNELAGQACMPTLWLWYAFFGMKLYLRVKTKDIRVNPCLVWLTWFRSCEQGIFEPLFR